MAHRNATANPATRERVAAEVRAAIARAGLKPHEVAAATGINRSTLARRLAGESSFTVDEAARIARILNADAAGFFTTIFHAAANDAAA